MYFSNNPMTKIPNAKKKKKMMMMMMKQKQPNLFAIKLEEYNQTRQVANNKRVLV